MSFLKQINSWRLSLGTDIRRNVPLIDEETLNISVQRILNRIIFLRICEDRSFEQYETLKQIKSILNSRNCLLRLIRNTIQAYLMF